ncbi:GntR family transcriptional regulator [Roseovarius aestuarii]|nr:GntR family transcriptional regulator [Roseovarius aestuarii]
MTKQTVKPAVSAPLMQREEAYLSLERLIVTGQLAPGAWVSETDLMKVSGHSRASVRFAVQRLQDQGLISIVPRRGARICPLDITLQFRAQELRRVVEGLLARCAAERATEAQRQQFRQMSQAFCKHASDRDAIAMMDLDIQHHSLMSEAADNTFAAKAMHSVKGVSRRFWLLHYEKHGDVQRMADVHHSVATAIAEGQPDKAEAAVRDLVDYVEEFTLRVVGFTRKD